MVEGFEPPESLDGEMMLEENPKPLFGSDEVYVARCGACDWHKTGKGVSERKRQGDKQPTVYFELRKHIVQEHTKEVRAWAKNKYHVKNLTKAAGQIIKMAGLCTVRKMKEVQAEKELKEFYGEGEE